jgi:hypothetical protein
VSKLPETERLLLSLRRVNKVLNKQLKRIDEDNNNLPHDGFKWLAFINADISDYIDHLERYDSYDLG